jgi:hypothetical protein
MTEQFVQTEGETGETGEVQITRPVSVDAKCPRCNGNVIVPTVVHWSNAIKRWREQAQCMGCGVRYGWYDGSREEPPAGDLSGRYRNYEGWFADRPLDAPAPIEVNGLK